MMECFTSAEIGCYVATISELFTIMRRLCFTNQLFQNLNTFSLIFFSVSTSSAMNNNLSYYGDYDDSVSDDEINADTTECYYGHWKSDMRTG